jgi:pyruvate/2-oxoglutarate dehydrogenase complex dihydrolipoamide dehydrogenase (E3) component
MKALKGLIIVNKLGSKVEVFTISDQTYEHKDGEADTVVTRVLTSLKKEQKNAFDNSKEAKKATEALE